LIGTSLSPNPRVLIGDRNARVVQASWDKIDFLCPDNAEGAELDIAVETSRGRSNAIQSTMARTAPGLFTISGIPGQSQAQAYQTRHDVAGLPTFWYAGSPAKAGEALTVVATGIACDDNSNGPMLRIRVGDQYGSIRAVGGTRDTGVCSIEVVLPASAKGDSVPLVLESLDGAGRPVESNRVFVAIDGQL
jgi:uncharacterized protein (TIGR03437 family)